MLMTISTHYRFNTTIYELDDRHKGILNRRRVILMNPADITKHKLKASEIVNLHNKFNNT